MNGDVPETETDKLPAKIPMYDHDDLHMKSWKLGWNAFHDAVITARIPAPSEPVANRAPSDWFVWLRLFADDTGSIPSDKFASIARKIADVVRARIPSEPVANHAVGDVADECADGCQYAKDVDMPQYACAKVCQYTTRLTPTSPAVGDVAELIERLRAPQWYPDNATLLKAASRLAALQQRVEELERKDSAP